MKILKKLNRDELFQVKIALFEGSYQYVLCSANDNDEKYIFLDDEEVQE